LTFPDLLRTLESTLPFFLEVRDERFLVLTI
jgi:hypothetical protein